MKKLFTLLLSASFILGAGIFAACSYDDGALWKEVDGIKKDMESLRTKVNSMNTDIGSLKTLVDALNQKDFVRSVADNPGGGYTITFGSGKTISVKDGKNGQDGKDGENGKDGQDGKDGENGKDGQDGKDGKDGKDAPVIGVKTEGGVYYWTITTGGVTEWLTDSKGGKLPVTGPKGESGPKGDTGTTPVIGIDSEGYWTADTGTGAERIMLDGEPIKAVGPKGDQGDSFFGGVQVDESAGTVTFTLNDGTDTVFVLPLVKDFAFSIDTGWGTEFSKEMSRTFAVTSQGVQSVMVTRPDGWRVSLNEEMTEVTITAPSADNPYAQREGDVAVAVFNSDGFARTVSFGVKMVDYVVIEDPEFKSLLKIRHPDIFDEDDKITYEAAASMKKSMSVSGNSPTDLGKITSLKGIEYFTALSELYCRNSRLTSLDLSKNTLLKKLYCDFNSLTSLDLSNNPLLELVYCYSNQLTSLEFGNNKVLSELQCYDNRIIKLDVSANTGIQRIFCRNNQLKHLEVGPNTRLEVLHFENNFLKSLDVRANTGLTSLRCHNNELTYLDLSYNNQLVILYCYNNNLSFLDISGCKRLLNEEKSTDFLCYGQKVLNDGKTQIKVSPGFNPPPSKDKWKYDADKVEWLIP